MKKVLIILIFVGCLMGMVQVDTLRRADMMEKQIMTLFSTLPKESLYAAMTVKNFQTIMSDFGIRLSRFEQGVNSQRWRSYQQSNGGG